MSTTYVIRPFGGVFAVTSGGAVSPDAIYNVVGSGFIPGVPGIYGNVTVEVYHHTATHAQELIVQTSTGTVLSDTFPSQDF